jgi:hypothetical protein
MRVFGMATRVLGAAMQVKWLVTRVNRVVNRFMGAVMPGYETLSHANPIQFPKAVSEQGF